MDCRLCGRGGGHGCRGMVWVKNRHGVWMNERRRVLEAFNLGTSFLDFAFQLGDDGFLVNDDCLKCLGADGDKTCISGFFIRRFGICGSGGIGGLRILHGNCDRFSFLIGHVMVNVSTAEKVEVRVWHSRAGREEMV